MTIRIQQLPSELLYHSLEQLIDDNGLRATPIEDLRALLAVITTTCRGWRNAPEFEPLRRKIEQKMGERRAEAPYQLVTQLFRGAGVVIGRLPLVRHSVVLNTDRPATHLQVEHMGPHPMARLINEAGQVGLALTLRGRSGRAFNEHSRGVLTLYLPRPDASLWHCGADLVTRVALNAAHAADHHDECIDCPIRGGHLINRQFIHQLLMGEHPAFTADRPPPAAPPPGSEARAGR